MNPKKAIKAIMVKEGYRRFSDIAYEIKVLPQYIYKWRDGVEPCLKHAVLLSKSYPYVKKYLGL